MIRKFVDSYIAQVREAFLEIDEKIWREALDSIGHARNFGKVYVAGNGGSAAISEHLTCDFSKGCEVYGQMPLKTTSLSSNMPLLTAIANDISYEEVFSKQLKYNGLCSQDVVILISSSGNSANIVHAAKYAIQCGAKVIGLTGFKGGELKKLSYISFHIPLDNYGMVEDCHQSVMHCLAQMHLKEAKEWL